jgi:CBS domain-containing protein
MMQSVIIVTALTGLILAVYSCLQKRSSNALKESRRATIPSTEVRQRILDKHQQIRRLGKDLRDVAKADIRVGDVMTENVCWASENTGTDEILVRMRDQRTRHLVIQDQWGHPIGIISNRDAIAGGRTAKDVMTWDPITVSITSPLGHAVALMLSNRISCLPVVDHQVLKGIITTTDLLMVLDCLLEIHEEQSCGTTQPQTEEAEAIGVIG